MAGGSKLISSALNLLFGGPMLPNHVVRGQLKTIPGLGVGIGRPEPRKIGTVDLKQANQIAVEPLNWPLYRALMAEVDARQGSKIRGHGAQAHRVTGGLRVMRGGVECDRVVAPAGAAAAHVRSTRRGATRTRRHARCRRSARRGRQRQSDLPSTPSRRAADTEGEAAEAPPLIKKLDGTISDVVVGGGGRYLLLTLSDASKLAIFDTNAAEIVKTIPLPSPNAIVAAGATKFLIAFPRAKADPARGTWKLCTARAAAALCRSRADSNRWCWAAIRMARCSPSGPSLKTVTMRPDGLQLHRRGIAQSSARGAGRGLGNAGDRVGLGRQLPAPRIREQSQPQGRAAAHSSLGRRHDSTRCGTRAGCPAGSRR